MTSKLSDTIGFCILVTPHFNLATTSAFLDPFRAANYLTGESRFKWTFVSTTGGDIQSSNGMSIATQSIADTKDVDPDVVVVSSSWAPERYQDVVLKNELQRWAISGTKIGGLDTGGFILAKAGLLDGKSATVHYEHIDAFIEVFPNVTVTENLFVFDGNMFTCCGGNASVDLALNMLQEMDGESIANAVARYLFHHDVRGPDASQNPTQLEPFGQTTPSLVRRAIDLLETHLENPLPIPKIAEQLNVSQRHLGRLFKAYVGKTPVLYYRDIRLDRARGLVTQTELKLSEVAVASGFSGQVHFSRAYQERFGLSPKKDRIEGRVPFEFRAWPMYNPD
ncbi:MAG: GlxA family transcriptional regulator [Shimia sp.]|uniref:GlxA family transcriptional regulator n=1 Tax=Shimia sp. TaxID=1954381 RepID=UPI0040589907